MSGGERQSLGEEIIQVQNRLRVLWSSNNIDSFCTFLNKKLNYIEIIGLIFSFFGLIASNNRTVLILILISTSFLAYKHLNFSKIIKNLMINNFTLSLI